MNEDQDFNETPNSESIAKENLDPNDMVNTNEAKKHSITEENIGEATIGAAETSAKTAKFRKNKKNVDDAQDAKIAELTNDLQRTRADFENFRRQTEVQKEQYGNAVKYSTVKKMLPLLDDIDRAIAANPDTLGPLQKSFEKTVKELGLSKIPTEVGTIFDPDLHDAVMVEGDGDEEVIGEVLRPGYYYGQVVIRAAMVKVKKQWKSL